MAMNLRCDQYFVEDEHWHRAVGINRDLAESIADIGKKIVL